MADFGLSQHPSAESKDIDFHKKFHLFFRRYKKIVLVGIYKESPSDNKKEQASSSGVNIIPTNNFYLICYFCTDSRFHLIPGDKFNFKFIKHLHCHLNQKNGHGANAVVDNSYKLGDTQYLAGCESRQFQGMFWRKCSRNKIFLGIYSQYLNFSLVSGEFNGADGTSVLRICITLCYTNISYLTNGQLLQIFITSNEATNFIYCQRSKRLEMPGWEYLTSVFEYKSWAFLILSSALIGLVNWNRKSLLDYILLIQGQSLQGKWRRKCPWLALCLATGTIVCTLYQGKVTVDLIAPLRITKIKSIQELLMRRSYKIVTADMPKEDNLEMAKLFSKKQLIYDPNKFYLENPEMIGTSPTSALERGDLAGKNVGKGAVLVNKPRIMFALAATRYRHPNLSCNFVDETWDQYWETWMVKSHLAHELYVIKYRMLQAGFYTFWDHILQFQ
ncbi:unnamed protein product, partial [Allacma fusca]